MLAGIAAIAVAWQQPGFPAVPPLSVDDSVWVVNEESSLVGRVNTGIGELDSAAAVRTASNILQDPTGQSAGPVFVVDQTKHELQALDTTTVTFGTRVSIPDNATVQLGGGTLAVTDRVDGRLWVGSAAAVSSVDLRAIAPQTTLGALPVIAISTQGTVVGTAAGSSSLVRLAPGLEPADSTLPAGALSLGDADNAASGADVSDGAADIQLTMVGETPVVLDRADPSLRIGDQRFALPLQEPAGRSVVLQQPGPAATEVLIAAEDGLYAVGLDDGAIRTITNAAGAPVAPVTTGSCSYAAWRPLGGDLTAISSCGKAAGQLVLPEGATGTVRPTFRQHGDAVVLGAADTGKSWVASSNYRLVDNWADVQPPDSAAADQIDQDNPNPDKDDLPAVPPDCSNVPIGTPQAADDAFGVRAGRATVLRVLDNDPSVDCTSVVIDKVSALPPELGSVAIVGDGNSIQLTVPATAAAGSLPAIEYEVSNGRTGTATAQVTVTVEPTSESKPPLPVRRSVASTEVNGTVSYNVLDDYFSPVGDDLYLQSASTDSADLVSFRPDGTITYRNTGTGAGTDSRVNFSITDGSKQANGILIVTLAAEDSSTPVAYPSFISAVVGSTAVAHPLRNVVSAASAPVVIGTVRSEPGSEAATAQLNPIDGSVAIAATAPGDYYFSYEAAAGGRAVTGVLRAQFLEPTDQSRSVVPMTDIAYLPANGETVIDPLANDNDPDGQGLAVREVQIDPNGPIIAAVVDLHLVQLSAPRPPKAPVTVGYSVFDGANTRNGQIRVVPVAAPKQIPPPLAAPIAATVRAGDAVTIPVARFASSQDGSPITAELDEGQLGALPGRAFSTGDTIRYLAAADAPLGQVTFSYTAVAGSSTPLAPVQAVSSVTITVTAADPARNAAPNTPNQITARVFADGIIDISVPLAGTDPDGDWVVLSSIEQPEAPLGTVAVSGADSLTYQAFGVPGVDRIRYLATDPAGLTATGEITVLVAEPGEFARPPVAPDLAIAVRPGASIRVDPLAVVVDPGGQRVRFASPAFTATTGLQVEQDDQGLIVTAPAEETVASLSYEVINTKGLRASGSVRVTVAADAPVPLPAARDVFVKPADLAANNETVDVDVSGSIINRSGRRDQLAVAVDPLSANQAVMTGPTTIRVTVSGTRQIVAYRVTDTFGVGATAFVVVPPRQQLVGPQLIAGMPPISFPAGQSVEVEIGDYVTVGGGRAAEIAASPEPRATQGAAVRTSSTTLTLSAPTSAGGQAAVYVPIDDGAGSAVVLSLPVQIVPRVVPPPKLDSSELSVEAGTSASIDLAALTTTSDLEQAGSLSYGVGPGSGGVQSGQDDSTTTVTVAPDVPRGTVLALPIQVSDGDGRDGKATLTVTVTGSRKPLPTVLDQQIDQGRAGVAVSADLLTGSSDPVGLGLTVGAVSLEEGQVAAGPIVTGSTVALTPAAGFVGSIVVAAEISDGTKDPERVVTARLRVAIQDKPSAPGVPTPVEGTVTAGSVQLTWAPADANGAAIDGYTVIGNGIRQDCAGSASTCTIDGLTAGQPYAFVVTARNLVGESPPSAPSAAIVPDAAPPVPSPPVATYLGKGQLSVSWSAPSGDFTAVTAMSVQVAKDGAVAEIRENASSPLTLIGLDSGAGYSFQVLATNQAGSSDWSAASPAIVPSGTPAAPASIAAEFVYDDGRRGAQVSWEPPADTGGEPVQGYTLLVNGGVNATGDADFRTAFVPIDSDAAVSVSVLARNGRGDGPATAPVDVRPFSRPTTVTGLTVAAQDGALGAAWNPADAPGSSIDHYDYRVDGGGWTSAGNTTTTTISGLTNGQTYQVEVRACNDQASFAEDVRCGPAGGPASGRPFGGLADPTVQAALIDPRGQQVRAEWAFPAGNGREVSKQTVKVSGDEQAELDPTKSPWTSEIGYGKAVTVTVQYCVTGPDECSEEVSASVSTPTAYSLPTIALAPLLGSCGVSKPYGGEWLTDQNCTGNWVIAPAKVSVLCVQKSEKYPEFPVGNPAPLPFKELSTWYLTTDQKWYRTPAVGPVGNTNIPPC